MSKIKDYTLKKYAKYYDTPDTAQKDKVFH